MLEALHDVTNIPCRMCLTDFFYCKNIDCKNPDGDPNDRNHYTSSKTPCGKKPVNCPQYTKKRYNEYDGDTCNHCSDSSKIGGDPTLSGNDWSARPNAAVRTITKDQFEEIAGQVRPARAKREEEIAKQKSAGQTAAGEAGKND